MWKAAPLLALAWSYGCSGECAEQEIAFDLIVASPMLFASVDWRDQQCSVSAISGRNVSLQCDDLEPMILTRFVTFLIPAIPEVALPFVEGEPVTLNYRDSQGFRRTRYVSIRSSSQDLLLAGQTSGTIEVESSFYRPLSISESSRDCGSETDDCGTRTRKAIDIALDGTNITLFDRQSAMLPGFAIFVVQAADFAAEACTTDIRGTGYDFFVLKQ